MTRASQRPAPALPEKILRNLLKAQEKENFKKFTSRFTTILKEKLKKSVFFCGLRTAFEAPRRRL
jgi:hypothetical protein